MPSDPDARPADPDALTGGSLHRLRVAPLMFDASVSCTQTVWSLLNREGEDGPTNQLVLVARLLGEVWRRQKTGTLADEIEFVHRLAGMDAEFRAVRHAGGDGHPRIVIALQGEG